jgi:hypothetical protein
MRARSELIQGDWVAREQRSIRKTEVINHGLHCKPIPWPGGFLSKDNALSWVPCQRTADGGNPKEHWPQ